jgi:hypothetical protein
MSALTVYAIVDQLHDAGLNLFLAPAGGLAVAPSSHLTADLRDLIRCSKAMLIDWLTAGNDATNPEPDPPDNPQDWHELDAAYLAHYVNCKTCIAAGRGIRYGLRCGTGAALWLAYSDAAQQPTTVTHPPRTRP